MTKRILAADIGGTSSRMIFAEVHSNQQTILIEDTYTSNDFDDLASVIKTFISDYEIHQKIDAACFAIAGPVESCVGSLTNLPWTISEAELKNILQVDYAKLINDFTAVSYGISELNQSDFCIVQSASDNSMDNPLNNAAVLGAGTGFGASHRLWINNSLHVLSSESGHVGFAPENTQQLKLLAWLQKNNSHVSLENVLSGNGLHTLYKFIHEVEGIAESDEIKLAMNQNDPAQVISDAAISNSDHLCQKTLELFIDIYGAAAGNVALSYYPVKEVYIAGGIAPKIISRLNDHRFVDAFSSKGLMSTIMKNISIKVVLQDKVGLYGALYVAKLLVTNY